MRGLSVAFLMTLAGVYQHFGRNRRAVKYAKMALTLDLDHSAADETLVSLSNISEDLWVASKAASFIKQK